MTASKSATDDTATYSVNYTPRPKADVKKLRHLASDLRHMRDSESIGETKKDDHYYCNLIDQALDVIDDKILEVGP